MNKAITTFLALFLVIWGFSVTARAQIGSIDTIDALIAVDSVEVTPGSSFSVQVRLSNNIHVFHGLSIPLQYHSPHLTLDSVSFENTIIPEGMTAYPSPIYTTDTVHLLAIPDISNLGATLSDSTGVLAELFFSLSAAAPPQVIPLDSILVDNKFGTPNLRISFTDITGYVTYWPQFRPGAITVKVSLAVEDEIREGLLPGDFVLAQNYPNPFNPATAIEFSLPRAGQAELRVFNILGQELVALVDDFLTAGLHRVEWNAGERPSGIYFYRLTYDGRSETKKMVFVK